MNIFQDIVETNKNIIPKAFQLAVKNWPIVFTGIIYSIISILLFRIASLFWILAGILLSLVVSALFSNYLYLIENIIRYGKISFEDFKRGFTVYIWKIYGAMVVIWLVNYGASLLLGSILRVKIGFISFWALLQWIAFLLLNCLPEVIYQKHYAVGESFNYSFSFIKENWIDWFVPNIFLGLLLYIVMGRMLTYNVFLGVSFLHLSIRSIIIYFAGQFLLSFMMVYRGLLFDILSSTTRRKRIFMRNVYK
ncbi:hypothetical protein FQB35_09110 [Crassaminicella thermophila]|uniref:Uncharacterized protein n=1 Tax=Crassaminicella thermophila TaxID=2599308 RepID=A0A5C0SEV7_CRATE|nr:hypothetical protein [Crassaminicella thermophila]QEK12472.1 hypothetical protein FQB35_09110 [Crassaminicella thermophila]